MSTGVPLASGKSEIFEIVLQFMPDWVQIPVLVLALKRTCRCPEHRELRP